MLSSTLLLKIYFAINGQWVIELYLPPYSPDLNRIEQRRVLAGKSHPQTIRWFDCLRDVSIPVTPFGMGSRESGVGSRGIGDIGLGNLSVRHLQSCIEDFLSLCLLPLAR